MSFNLTQIIATLVAALAFVIAFMAAGSVLLSSAFMLLGIGATAYLAFCLIRGAGKRTHNRNA